MPVLHYRAILFDMDGVLVDSTPAVARVWAHWAQARGFDPSDVIRRAHGRPSITSLRELLPDGDHEAENREVERLEIADIADVIALPGALQLTQALPADKWTIVTSATRRLAEVRIRAAGLAKPQTFISFDDVARGKPFPDPYLKGAETLRTSPGDCLVIEDAPAGIVAGKAAGAQVLALRTTAPDRELFAAGADWIVDDCSCIRLQPLLPNGKFIAAHRYRASRQTQVTYARLRKSTGAPFLPLIVTNHPGTLLRGLSAQSFTIALSGNRTR